MSNEPLKAKDLRSMSMEDRLNMLNELRRELIKLYSQARSGTLTNTSRIRIIRKNIARLLTVINEEKFQKRTEGGAT